MIYRHMDEKTAKQICSWRYEAPYDVYNYMSYEEAIQSKAAILDCDRAENYLCFWKDDCLVAYISIFLNTDKVFLGIGVAPELCGKALGKVCLNQGIREAQKKHPDRELWIQVRSWNERAIRCYKSCGFTENSRKYIKDRFGNCEEFVFMCYRK